MARGISSQIPLLCSNDVPSAEKGHSATRKALFLLLTFVAIAAAVGVISVKYVNPVSLSWENKVTGDENAEIESEDGVVAADDSRCSQIGASVLRKGGHAVDSAVTTAVCLGVVNAMASGIGGGGFMVVRSSSSNSKVQAFDMRETAPSAATKNMYANDIDAKYLGPLSMGVPGEIAGLYQAWLQYGRLPWNTLFQPAIKLAKDGFVVAPYLANSIVETTKILNDPGLKTVYAPNGKLLKAGDVCYNVALARTLEAIAEHGPEVMYNGSVGENLVKDVRAAGGIIKMEDLNNYKVRVTDAVAVDAMGYTIYGMPSPSSGTLGISLVMNILKSYGSRNAAKGDIGLHRIIESLKHMFALRMNLGDPDFVDITEVQAQMLSPAFAEKIQKLIFDNTTFPPEYYMHKWSQLRDHGTSHFCIVDAERNAVSMTSTVNYGFGAGLLSPSTGIVINNEMGDFSAPTEISPDLLPPSPANFIEPNKRPLSSMTPIIITKGNQLAGVLGGSGGLYIIPAIVQVFLNHFVLGMEPLHAVLSPRVYHDLIPNVVKYENWTLICGDHIELADERKAFLKERGHQLSANSGGAIVQLVVQSLHNTTAPGRKVKGGSNAVVHGILTAVSDLRKDGRPAAV
ncbi:Glutathione hydrolase 3 [Linum grandiflorum]